jgi:electron transfer flavoprotein beta subunit
VHSSAPECRHRKAKLVMKYKHARTLTELQNEDKDYYSELYNIRPYLQLNEWTVDDLDADVALLGLSGSPTKVKKIENVVFQAKDSKVLTSSDQDIESLVKELLSSHVIG